jgi:hypothetical protein
MGSGSLVLRDECLLRRKNAHLLSWIDQFEMVNPDNNIVSDYGDLAQELLGLSAAQADGLFSDNIHSTEELREIIDDIRAGG